MRQRTTSLLRFRNVIDFLQSAGRKRGDGPVERAALRRTAPLLLPVLAVMVMVFCCRNGFAGELDTTYPPQAVDPKIYLFGDPYLSRLADRVSNGTASMPERRDFDNLTKMLGPYSVTPVSNWRELAVQRASLVASPATWRQLWPSTVQNSDSTFSGRAEAIWVNPSNSNHILLGASAGGVWKTTDQGVTWASIFGTVATQSVGTIAVDPNNVNVIYVGTGHRNDVGGIGVVKSTDGGSTWSTKSIAFPLPDPSQHCIRRIAVDPLNSNRVFAAGNGGLYRSTDGGNTFIRNPGSGLPADSNQEATDVVLDNVNSGRTDASIVYVAFGKSPGGASIGNGIYRSLSVAFTQNWQHIENFQANQGITPDSRIVLALAPSDRKKIYALVYDGTGSPVSVLRSVSNSTPNGAVTWTVANGSTADCDGQCEHDMAIGIDPVNPANVVVGTVEAYRSTDSGTTLALISGAHVDHDSIVLPNSTTIHDASDGGFTVGTISGSTVSWAARNAELSTEQLYGIAGDVSEPIRTLGGMQDNGTELVSCTATSTIDGSDGGPPLWDRSDPHFGYTFTQVGGITRQSLPFSSNGAATCLKTFGGCACAGGCNPDNQMIFVGGFAMDANDSNVLFAGTRYVYRNGSARTSTSWAKGPQDLMNNNFEYVSVLHSAFNNGVPGRLYAGSISGRVFFTSNADAASPSWSTRTPSVLASAWITGIATDPANANRVLACAAGPELNHVARSTDAGVSWANLTSAAIQSIPFWDIALDPSDVNHAYAASDIGVFENTSVWTSNIWSYINGTLGSLESLPVVSVRDLDFNPQNGNLRIATYGRSTWELDRTVTNPVISWVCAGGNLVQFYAPDSRGWSWTFKTSGGSVLGTSNAQNPVFDFVSAGSYQTVLASSVCGASPGSTTISLQVGQSAPTITSVLTAVGGFPSGVALSSIKVSGSSFAANAEVWVSIPACGAPVKAGVTARSGTTSVPSTK